MRVCVWWWGGGADSGKAGTLNIAHHVQPRGKQSLPRKHVDIISPTDSKLPVTNLKASQRVD